MKDEVNEQRLRRCLKNIVDTWQREDPQAVFLPGQPIFEIAYWILGDQRVIPNRAGKFTLRSFKIYGIELWKARRLWYRRDASPDYVLATAHEQLKALLTAARKLAENSAVGARRAEYLQKINEKVDRQKKSEYIEKQSVVNMPRPRTVPDPRQRARRRLQITGTIS